MSLLKALIGGLIGAAIGAAVWAAMSYYAHYELGLIAWGIGVLAGVGVRVGAGEHLNGLTGLLAVVIALVGIIAGKWGAVSLVVSGFDVSDFHNETTAISGFAHEVAYERQQAGSRLSYPPGVDPDTAYGREAFPPDVWSEAKQRYQALSHDKREKLHSCPDLANPDCLTAFIARGIAEDAEAAGERVDWPQYMEMDERVHRTDYPPRIWSEAEAQWGAMSPREQEDFEHEVRQYLLDRQKQRFADAAGVITFGGLLSSLSLWDLLWVFLAVASAWKLGTGEAQSIGEA